MKTLESFTIKVHSIFYNIKPFENNGDILYEVFTNCEKLFTLKKNQQNKWETEEKNVVPISDYLIEDIGDMLQQFQVEMNGSWYN